MEPQISLDSMSFNFDNNVWEESITTKDENAARLIFEAGKLPDGIMFQQVCSTYGRHSELVKDICKTVCSYIEKLNKEIIDIWPAYKFNESSEPTGSDELIFVVITKNEDDRWRNAVKYNIYQRKLYQCSEESTVVNRIERDREFECSEKGDVMDCINKITESLLKKHSNITMISESWMKSIGFGTETADLQERHCVVLYTHVKGLIPISDEPFPTTIGGFPVDVREAVFRPLGRGPSDHHENIKMGCAIRNGRIDDKGQCFIGTIGGFLQHPKYGLCCITAAHVLIGDLKNIPECRAGYRKIILGEPNFPVFQPVCIGARSFGNLVEAIYYEGSIFEAGVDVALIKITERHPNDGLFPDSRSSEENGFSAEKPMIFRDGKICSNLKKGNIVLKYGSCSEVTRGVFRTNGANVRQATMIGKLKDFDFLLRNQIEIYPVANKPFAEYGDSGALVFIEENGELYAIGVLEGDMGNGVYMVSPISDVLKALEMPDGSTMKNFDGKCVRVLESRVPSETNERLPAGLSTSSSFSSQLMNSSMADSGYIQGPSSNSELNTINDDGLKVINENIAKKLESQSQEFKQEMNQNLSALKEELKAELREEFEQMQKAQLEAIKNMLAPLFSK